MAWLDGLAPAKSRAKLTEAERLKDLKTDIGAQLSREIAPRGCAGADFEAGLVIGDSQAIN
jgi:hypothetical protein